MKLGNTKQTNKIQQDKDEQVQSPTSFKRTVPQQVWTTLQFFWNKLVLCPLVVLFWRSCWNLLDTIISQNLNTEFWLLFFIVVTLLDLAKPYLAGWLLNKWFPLRYLAGWLFNTLKAVAMVALWRSSWVHNNKIAADKPYYDISSQMEAVFFFLVLGFGKSLVQNSFVVEKDSHISFFQKTRIFKMHLIWHPLLEASFNTAIKEVVACSWFSSWSLQTTYLTLPTGQIWLDSLLLSATLVILYLPLHLFLCQLTATTKKKPFVRSLDLAVTVADFYSSASLWLSLWTVLDDQLPAGPQTDLLSLVFSLGATSLLGVANSLGQDKITWDFRFWDFWGEFCPKALANFSGPPGELSVYHREEEEWKTHEEVALP